MTVNAVAMVAAPLNVMLPVVLVRVTVGTVVVPVIVVLLLFVTVKAVADRFPPIKTAPPVPPLRVRLFAPPVTFPEKEMPAPARVPPAFVASMSDVALSVTGPVKVMIPPAVVTLPPILMAVDPL